MPPSVTTSEPVIERRVVPAHSLPQFPRVHPGSNDRIRIDGRMFRAGSLDWNLKGFTYGPFRPNNQGQFLPPRQQLLDDLAAMRNMGCNAIRLYHPPSPSLLDDALAHDIRVMIDVPWEKHRCFFEDWSSQRNAIATVRKTARELGRHKGLFAISVGNEIPHDIVRFYGASRIERFIEQLIETAKSEAPDCLFTYANYPSTEFLSPRNLDFYCANVYLHDGESLGRYLDHLQHVAGNRPLILGEYGFDTLRHSEAEQTEALRTHLCEVFCRGLAGSFIFSYTDDWFTGGHQIQDWAFGVTRADRSAKPTAAVVSKLWSQVSNFQRPHMPRASVVVCSYNGAATLDECLNSLQHLDYPDYEIILIDDGSTDNTRQIAAKLPEVRYVYQANQGLSAARNAGAQKATGHIVAYTDSDCVADRRWLLNLVQAMEHQQVYAIGGPNVPPQSDSWTAKCVAAAPGGPSHVMLDDLRAEHVPGCNMAFRREQLLALGGFDPQFRQAGDDVDICWRFLDAGYDIGYAPSALVWHHRRNTIRAYWKQQAGYGRSEAMLMFKHPQRFNGLGYSKWLGVIYDDNAAAMRGSAPPVYHGQFGTGLFQIVYRRNDYNAWTYVTLFEWHVLALMVLTLTPVFPAAAMITGAMWLLTLLGAMRSLLTLRLPARTPKWCWPVIYLLNLGQPIVRGWHRHKHYWKASRVPRVDGDDRGLGKCSKTISWREHDLYWSSNQGLGREHMLRALVASAQELNWHGDYTAEWQPHDVELCGGLLHIIQLRTATEELGGANRFTRARCVVEPSRLAIFLLALLSTWSILSAFHPQRWPIIAAAVMWTVLLSWLLASRRRCRRAVSRLLNRSAIGLGLLPAQVAAGDVSKTRPEPHESRDLYIENEVDMADPGIE